MSIRWLRTFFWSPRACLSIRICRAQAADEDIVPIPGALSACKVRGSAAPAEGCAASEGLGCGPIAPSALTGRRSLHRPYRDLHPWRPPPRAAVLRACGAPAGIQRRWAIPSGNSPRHSSRSAHRIFLSGEWMVTGTLHEQTPSKCEALELSLNCPALSAPATGKGLYPYCSLSSPIAR